MFDVANHLGNSRKLRQIDWIRYRRELPNPVFSIHLNCGKYCSNRRKSVPMALDFVQAFEVAQTPVCGFSVERNKGVTPAGIGISGRQPMEGDTVQSRPWFHLFGILPTPLRWAGRELLRILIGLDHAFGRLLVTLRKSPAWSFVCLAGTIGVGLTVLLFISVVEQTSSRHPKTSHQKTVLLGREHLERNHEWSAEDHWRIAHFFVSHKPIERFKNIKVDSRLASSDVNVTPQSSRPDAADRSMLANGGGKNDVEVRLDLRRPRKAAQDKRFIAQSTVYSATSHGELPASRTRFRDPRLLVQAAWEFGSDCDQSDYVSMPPHRPVPTRRPIPEPIPERESPPIPISKGTPDVSLEWTMTKQVHSPEAFPNGSYLITQSERSVFPIDDFEDQTAQTGFGEQGWQQAKQRHEEFHTVKNRNSGLGNYEGVQGALSASDEFDPELPSATEINLLVQFEVAGSPDDERAVRSTMRIRNEGRHPIAQIEVQDLVDPPNTIVAVKPDATTEAVLDPESQTSNQLLHREIHGLLPDDHRQLNLDWQPARGQNFHRARLFAEAVVSRVTEVVAPETPQQMPSIPPEVPPPEEPVAESLPEANPVLACDLNYPEAAYVGDTLELHLTARNRGDVPLHRVQVRIELPDQLTHPDGREVVVDVGSLEPNGRTLTVVKVTALQAGDAVNGLHITADEQVQAKGKATIKVMERPSPVLTPEPNRPKPPSKSTLLQTSATSIAPASADRTGKCCCQRSNSTKTSQFND
jgi:hypothetical protein